MRRIIQSRIRTMYINKRGEMFLQFIPDCIQDLKAICKGNSICEDLQSSYQVSGVVCKVTQSGVILKNWRLA